MIVAGYKGRGAMARNRYVKDYRLLESVDERGRIRVETQYIGSYYAFAADARTVRREKRQLIAVCAVGWAGFIAALLPVSEAMHTAYAALPFAFAALPLGLLTAAAFSIPTDGRLMERRTAEKLENSLPPRALFTAALPLLSLLGLLVRLLFGRGGLRSGDAVFALGAAVLAAAGGIAFSRRGRFAVRPTQEHPRDAA